MRSLPLVRHLQLMRSLPLVRSSYIGAAHSWARAKFEAQIAPPGRHQFHDCALYCHSGLETSPQSWRSWTDDTGRCGQLGDSHFRQSGCSYRSLSPSMGPNICTSPGCEAAFASYASICGDIFISWAPRFSLYGDTVDLRNLCMCLRTICNASLDSRAIEACDTRRSIL